MAGHRRLTSSADIRDVFAARTGSGTAHVVTHARSRGDAVPSRVAVVAGRRVGNAVTRNRAKRLLRECLRQATIPTGHDLVVTAKAGAAQTPLVHLHSEVQTSINGAVRRAASRPR